MREKISVQIQREFSYRPSRLEQAFEEELEAAGYSLSSPSIETMDARDVPPRGTMLPDIGPNILIAPNFHVRAKNRKEVIELRGAMDIKEPGRDSEGHVFRYGRYCLSEAFKTFTDVETFMRRFSRPGMYADLFTLETGDMSLSIENDRHGFYVDDIEKMHPDEIAGAINLFYMGKLGEVKSSEVKASSMQQIRQVLMARSRTVCSDEDALRMFTRFFAQQR